MKNNDFWDAAIAHAKVFKLDQNLVLALCEIESEWNPLKADFDPDFKDFVSPDKFAKESGVSEAAETMFQACTWGLMQIRGAKAREMGYKGPLQNLCSQWTGTEMGCLKLVGLIEEYPDESDTIAAWDLGHVERDEKGRHLNQSFVDRVQRRLNELRRSQK